MKPLYISFSEKNEIVLSENTLSIVPMGELLFSFLKINWTRQQEAMGLYKSALSEVPVEENSILSGYEVDSKNYLLWAECYQDILKYYEGIHPMLADVIDHQIEERLDAAYPDMPVMADFAHRLFRYYPEKPMQPEFIEDFSKGYGNPVPDISLIQATITCIDTLADLFGQFEIFRRDILRMINFALDSDSQYPELTSLQRYYLMQTIQYPPYKKRKKLLGKIKLDRKLINNMEIPQNEEVEEITDDMIQQISKSDLKTYSFYTSTDIMALVFAEFDYMCAEGLEVRRCANCGKYFLPFSSRSIYCNNISPRTGKACKETAAATNYRQKVEQDEAKRYYQKQNNAYQMRCRRSPALFPKEKHWEWQDMAKVLLKEVDKGVLSFDEFKEKIAIPKLK